MNLHRPAVDESLTSSIGQRRYATVLFTDLSGSSAWAERLEPEEFADLLRRFRRAATDVIDRHGGKVIRFEGDGMLAVFGLAVAREDDGRRATEAAVELHESLAHSQAAGDVITQVLTLHSGIHAGLVLVMGRESEHSRIDVVGEVPNTAARLCGLAAPGEILVSAESLGPQAHFFDVSVRLQVRIRGRSQSLEVVHVKGRAPVERRIDAAARRGIVPFVGRTDVMAQLIGAANSARSTPTLLVVIGEPGVGKTRLIDEFKQRIEQDGFRVLRGYCEGYLGAEPLQPFMQAIRDALGWRVGAPVEENEAAVRASLMSFDAGRAMEAMPAAMALLGGQVDAPELRTAAKLVSTILDLIQTFAQYGIVVLVLDDWQWADDASRQVLDQLRALELPLLMLMATRPFNLDDHALVGAETVRLGPLDAADSDAAIEAWLPGVNPFVAQEIYAQSGGSPLFIEELCHAAAAGEALYGKPRGAGVAWINALVAARMARLSEPEAELLRIASVVGTTFSVWLVERLMESADVGRLLESLAAQDFLISAAQAGSLRFKHVMTRDAVYGTVDVATRRALHGRVAEALRASVRSEDAFEWLEALSYHYDAAGSSAEAAQFAEAAGDKALAAMSLDRARAQFIAALRALDALPLASAEMRSRWCAIAQKLGQTCVFDPLDVTTGFTFFERAVEFARADNDLNILARAEYWLAYVNYGRGQPRQAVRYAEAALEHSLASGDQRLVTQVRATLAQALASSGAYDRAMPLFEQAIDSKRRQSHPGSRTAIGSAYTLGRLAYTLGDLGRFDEASARFDESLRLLGDAVHSVTASVHELMCAVHLWQGRWDEARREGLVGAEIAMRCRSRYLVAMGRALSACGRWASERSVEALQQLREPTQWIAMQGGAVSTSLNYGWLVEATAELGLDEELREQAAHLFRRARAKDRHGEAQGCRALARRAAALGDTARAQRYLARADAAAEHRGSPRERAVNRLARAEVMHWSGRSDDARALVHLCIADFMAMQMTWHLARAERLAQEL